MMPTVIRRRIDIAAHGRTDVADTRPLKALQTIMRELARPLAL